MRQKTNCGNAFSLFGAKCFIGGIQDGYGDPDKPVVEQPIIDRGGISIGRDVWLGAGAVVTKDIPPFTVAAGVPAKKIGERGNSSVYSNVPLRMPSVFRWLPQGPSC